MGKGKGSMSLEQECCPICGKVVYDAESYPAGGRKFHRRCLKCSACATKLNSQNIRVHCVAGEVKLFCKGRGCQAKVDPSEAPKMYLDTSKIAPTEEKGCPRCGGAVFEAEKVCVKDVFYHKKCLTCAKCSRALDSLSVSVAPDGDIYCKVCYKIVTAPERPQISDVAIIPAEDEKDGCPRCGGKVFEAEKMITKSGVYHKKCFSCINCKCQLSYYGAIEAPDNEIYCRVCYLRAYGPGGKNKYGDFTPGANSEDNECPDNCVRCGSKVFEVEKIITKAGVMHKRCLSCNECKMSLDASSFYNGFDGEVYCKYCYATKFGHKQKSTYNPSSIKDVMTIQGEKGDANTCPRCLGKVFEAERMVTRVGNFHRNCFSCIECNKKLDSTTCCEGPDGEIYCQSCYSFEFGTKARTKPTDSGLKNFRSRANSMRSRSNSVHMFKNEDDILARSTVETWVIKAEKGAQDCCPKCYGRVFEAEKMVSGNGAWYHRNCFRCVECSRMLDSLTNCDGPDGQLYCKNCYAVKFGPQMEHKIIDTASLKSEDPCKNCPRCGGAVFKAEAIISNGKRYHRKCASCASCEKQLTSNTILNGDDNEIYCINCYQRKFTPTGYRGAGCSSWVDKDSSDVLRHSYQAF